MVMYVQSTRLNYNQIGLRRMFLPGGETWRWFEKNVRRPMILKARRETPVGRHGRLLRGMRARTIGTNQFVVRIHMWNDVDYAAVVHEGHKADLYIMGRPKLWVGAQSYFIRGAKRPIPMDYVHGQKGNPWMRRSMEWALHRKGLL